LEEVDWRDSKLDSEGRKELLKAGNIGILVLVIKIYGGMGGTRGGGGLKVGKDQHKWKMRGRRGQL
jgi:hypothetical protein